MIILEDSYQNNLLARLKTGDETAFNGIYEAYSKPMYLKILSMTKDKDVADELLQELFIRLWDNKEKIIPGKSFQSYLYTITRNLVYNYFRKVASDNSLIEQLLLRGTDHYLNAEEVLLSKESAALLKNAIDQLSPQRKMVFELCKIDGKSYDEVSKLLGISVATVNSHITKSMQLIKAYLIKHQDTGLLFIGLYLASDLIGK
ncbi:RNA polymerase sigma-70 factor (ECF subfamily) [Pedobacter sp. AK017]|uniref:RNA polymerase sigma factor n=1 Tax=Pedobacter sp. AK017 TaxID=2723073 RepID=UPI00161EBEF4|nr:sigma-70 family RNA polymerase sigma factor [Pedobacter sp. AK017]MBB5439710.1 RNA polymerase sigma-70 factor (ECF subfamily) [Pedobacter sp. AK017]